MGIAKSSRHNWPALIQSLDEHLRGARIVEAKTLLKTVRPTRIPIEYRLPLARLCRRAGIETLGLRFLTPVMEPSKPLGRRATIDEKIEYAVLLSRIGSVKEPLAILSQLNPTYSPEILLYRGFCKISAWDYVAAAPDLAAYVATQGRDYKGLIGRVNWLAALAATGQADQAEILGAECIQLAKELNAPRLSGNCWEILGGMRLRSRQFAQSETALEHANQILREESLDRKFVEKWRAILEFMKTGRRDSIDAFERQAREGRLWETLRELDFYRLLVQFEPDRFNHLFHGSPHLAYKEMLKHELKAQASAEYLLGDGNSTPALTLDPMQARPESLNDGLLQALCQDFYSPTALAEVFARIYPNERFDIFSSPSRVRQAIHRLRDWLTEACIPISITTEDDGYQLVLPPGTSLKLVPGAGPSPSSQLAQLASRFGNHGMSLRDFAATLELSDHHARTTLRELLAAGGLERFGAGPKTRYFVSGSVIPWNQKAIESR